MIIACNENPKCKGCVLLKSNNCFIDEIRANIVEDKKYQNDDY
jgi:hypothetical protein